MIEISLPRIQRNALILGIAGAVVTAVIRSPLEALGFLIGAGISLITVRSWIRLSDSLTARIAATAEDGPVASPPVHAQPGGKKPGSPVGAALFMVLRYAIIGAAIYATIKVLGVEPLALLAGLLVSFLAVVMELLGQFRTPH